MSHVRVRVFSQLPIACGDFGDKSSRPAFRPCLGHAPTFTTDFGDVIHRVVMRQ
jgi:hypothetical protein